MPAAPKLLEFPWPFRAMAAIESDIDGTNLATFRETMRFLRTEADTLMGPGLGLDFVNSFWVYGPNPNGAIEHRMLYMHGIGDPTRTSAYADEVAFYVRSGWAATLHTFGQIGQAFSRDQAKYAIDRLGEIGGQYRIWTNHGRGGAQNIRSRLQKLPALQGDLPHEAAYHADLLTELGVKYFWPGMRGTVCGGTRTPARPVSLMDGQRVWAFERSIGSRHDMAAYDQLLRLGSMPTVCPPRVETVAWQVRLLEAMLAPAALQRLVDAGQYCIFGQHLGNLGGARSFPPSAIAALRNLKGYQDEKKILIASTARLLDYYVARTHLDFAWTVSGDTASLEIRKIRDPVSGDRAPSLAEVRGLSFVLHGARALTNIVVALNGKALPEAPLFFDRRGDCLTFGIRWHAVDRTDYAQAYDGGGSGSGKRVGMAAARSDPAGSPVDPIPAGIDALAFRPDGPALVIGDDLDGWTSAFDRAGQGYAVQAPGATAERDRATEAVITVLPMRTPLKEALAAARLAPAAPATRRIFHVRSGNRILADIASDRDAAAQGSPVTGLWEDELRRLGAIATGLGPHGVRSRAAIERAFFWGGFHIFGEVAWSSVSDSDGLGRRDLIYCGRFGALNVAEVFLRARRTSAMLDQLDFVAETYGGDAALELIRKCPPKAWGGARMRLRSILFEPSASAMDIERAASGWRRPKRRQDRLLAARALAGRGDADAGLAHLRELVGPDVDRVRGVIAGAGGSLEPAHAYFSEAFGAAPGAQAALVGLLYTGERLGMPIARSALINRYFSACEAGLEADRQQFLS